MKFFRKTGISTLINLIGMGLALTVFAVLMVQVRYDYGYDKCIPHHERTFRLENDVMQQGSYFPIFSRPIIEAVRSLDPNIEALGTMTDDVLDADGDYDFATKTAPEAFVKMRCHAIDSTMLNIMPIKWVEGDASQFRTRGDAIIAQSKAKLLFGDASAVGQTIFTYGANPDGDEYRICGVFEDLPANCSFPNGVYNNIGDKGLDHIGNFNCTPYIRLRDPALAENTAELTQKFILGNLFGIAEDEIDESRDKCPIRMMPLKKAYFARDILPAMQKGNRTITRTLLAIALLVLGIAIINFVNFSFAEIPFHIRNINTRKVLGSTRAQLIARQLAGKAVIAAVAMGLAVCLLHLVSGTMISSFINGSLRVTDNIGLIAGTLGLAMLVAVVAGVAPALYSTAQPAALVLKGSFAMSVKGKGLRNALLTLQLVISLIFIMMGLFMSKQIRYMQRYDMGFTSEGVIQVKCGSNVGAKHELFGSMLRQNPRVLDITYSLNELLLPMKMTWIYTEGKDMSDISNIKKIEVLPVSKNFVDFFGLELIDGRDFQESDYQDTVGRFIINQSFAEANPDIKIGTYLPNNYGQIVGTVKDFNSKSLHTSISPFGLYAHNLNQMTPGVAYVKVSAGPIAELMDFFRETVCTIDPNLQPANISVEPLDESIKRLYAKDANLGRLIDIASATSLLISIIGILGLVFFEMQLIRKQIAIKRVHGATIGSILRSINTKYLILTAIAFAIAAVPSYMLMNFWRKGFAYQTSIAPWLFALALLSVGAIMLIAVTLQSWSSANANPAKVLKSE